MLHPLPLLRSAVGLGRFPAVDGAGGQSPGPREAGRLGRSAVTRAESSCKRPRARRGVGVVGEVAESAFQMD